MDAEQAGRMTAFILIVLVVPIGIYVFGRMRSRTYEPALRAKTRRRFGIAALVAFLVLGAAAVVSNIGKLAETNVAQFRAGIERGCTKGCIKQTGKEALCKKLCRCVAKEFVVSLGVERIKSMRSDSDLTAKDRAKMVAAVGQCRRIASGAK